MSDTFWIYLPGTIAALGVIYNIYITNKSKKQSIDNGNAIKVMHESVNGLLAEKTIADKEIGKKQGVQQEKAEQKDRDDNK